MSYQMVLKGILFFCLLLPASAFAANSMLSGTLDGSEPTASPLPGTCPGTEPLGYQQAGTFEVSTTGLYTITDAFDYYHGVDISALVYSNNFNINSPLTNLVTPDGVDETADVILNSGTTYILVVQQYCWNFGREWIDREGAWAVAISGPGEVTSGLKVAVPEMTQGNFTTNDPTAETYCGNSQYQESGPVQVSTSGTYYYNDLSINFAVDMCLQIFTAPFDPANPAANRVFEEDDFGSVYLEAGKDYYFVTQPLDVAAEGEFFYVFAPPAQFDISFAMSGSWHYPPTTGQGFLIDIFDSANLMFLAWFTYDLERPSGGATAMIGDPGHRWMTAIGPFTGSTANLNITWSSGMIFDSETPAVTNDADGTITVEFYDCYSGLITYNLGSSGETGEVPIERIVNDAVPFCESMNRGPAKPGPL